LKGNSTGVIGFAGRKTSREKAELCSLYSKSPQRELYKLTALFNELVIIPGHALTYAWKSLCQLFAIVFWANIPASLQRIVTVVIAHSKWLQNLLSNLIN